MLWEMEQLDGQVREKTRLTTGQANKAGKVGGGESNER